MSPVRETGADTYGIVLPVGWTELPLDVAGFLSMARRLEEALEASPSWSSTLKRRIDLLFQQMQADLQDAAVGIAAIWAELEEPGEDGASRLITAGLAVSKLRAEALSKAAVDITVEQLAAGMGQSQRGSAADKVIDLAPATVVQLEHAGSAVRLERVYERKVSVLETLRFYAQSYLVPHDEGRSLCVVQFSTPNVEEVSLLDGLFEAIANTLRIFAPGDPTDFGGNAARDVDG
jgi:hypothetical protein